MNLQFNYHLYIADQTKPAIGCGYYYIVTYGSQSHTAFRTKRALKIWLKLTGLKIGKKTHNRGVFLVGQYTHKCVMLNNKDFFNTYGHLEPFYYLQNGSYSIGFMEKTNEGNILYGQNPNTDRMILDYAITTKLLETGKLN